MDDDDVPEAVPIAVAPQEEEAEDEHADREVANERVTSAVSSSGRSNPVPVLLITGFLGAGKTTLLNYILLEAHGYRCAVILNEFGESAGIEKALLNDSKENEAFQLEDWVQLSNGCACCSVKNDFVKALESLMSKEGTYDYILIETTGLASPGPIASALWTDAELEAGVCLDAILTICDASNIVRQLTEEREEGAVNEAQEQIAYADIILCNKIDRLPSQEALAEVKETIQGLNAEAHFIETVRCKIDLGQILNRGIFDPQRNASGGDANGAVKASENLLPESRQEVLDLGGRAVKAKSLKSRPTKHKHDTNIRTLRLELPGFLHLDRLKSWLDSILWEENASTGAILRLKGLVNIAEGRCQKVVQAVREVYDIQSLETPPTGRLPTNEVVLIGRHLNEKELLDSLANCLART